MSSLENKTAGKKKIAPKENKGMSAEMKRRKAVGDRNRNEREAFKGMSKAAKMREFKRMGILAPSERGK